MAALLFLDLCRSAGGIDTRSAKYKLYQAWAVIDDCRGSITSMDSRLCNNAKKMFLERMRGSIVVIWAIFLKT